MINGNSFIFYFYGYLLGVLRERPLNLRASAGSSPNCDAFFFFGFALLVAALARRGATIERGKNKKERGIRFFV